MMKNEFWRNLGAPFFIITFFLVPYILGEVYFVHLSILICLNLIASVSLWIVVKTGQLSLGQASFMAMGAYTSSLLTMRMGISFWASFLISGLIAAGIAFLLGFVILRIKGVYFAILTFAFCEIVRLFFSAMVDPFGGVNGIAGIRNPEPLNIINLIEIRIESPKDYLILALVVMLITYYVALSVERSSYRIIFKGISEADKLVESLGINTIRYKVFAFTIAGFFTGLSGSIFAHYFHYITPDFFTFGESVNFLTYIFVGGVGSIFGPIIGTILFTLLPEFLDIIKEYMHLIYGLILILVIVFLPGGIASLPTKVLKNRAARRLNSGK